MLETPLYEHEAKCTRVKLILFGDKQTARKYSLICRMYSTLY